MNSKVAGIVIVLLAGLLAWLMLSGPQAEPTGTTASSQGPGSATGKSAAGAEARTGAASAPASLGGSAAFKVALITPGPVTDGGWSQNAKKGLDRIKAELGAETRNAVASSGQDAYDTFRAYASEGHALVIGHASEWFDPKLLQIAERHPQVRFLISGCEMEAAGNVAGVRFILEDACFVLGFIAGSMSTSGVLGCVGPKKIPVIESTFDAFAKGARAARSDAVVRQVWTDSWDDVAAAKEKTLALIQQEKADFIFHNANNGGPGVFQAVHEKKAQGVLAFGSNDDQAGMAPDVVLASAVLDIPSVFLAAAREIKEQRFDGKTRFVGMPEGHVWVAFNPKLEEKMPAEVRKKAEEWIRKIKSREYKVERMILK